MIKILFIFLSSLILLPYGFYSSSNYVFGAPFGIISPTCGPVDEFEIKFNVDGFIPNNYVSWNFTGPDDVRVMHGYFATNSTGGFSEDAEIESIIPGEHTLSIFDDLKHDSSIDVNGSVESFKINIPCT